MKPLSDVRALCVDYGNFVGLAQRMSKDMGEVFYYSPYEDEYRDINKCCIGEGIEGITRVDDWMKPEFLKDLDLLVYPDIGFGGQQQLMKSLGKKVWGSMGASDLELYRTRFLQLLRSMDMPVLHSVTIRGLTALSEHLKTVKNKWVKINRYRSNTETFKHRDYDHTVRRLEQLAFEMGGAKELVVFVVQDDLESKVEIGYDGMWYGSYPKESFQGFEAKNELYLGSCLSVDRLPEEVRYVNEKMAPVMAEYGYCNFVATEIRVDEQSCPYFIDPTPRMAGQTQEHLLQSCTNLSEVIWSAANGEPVEPIYSHKFAAEATLHYTDDNDSWKTLRIPKEAHDRTCFYRFMIDPDGLHQFPTSKKTDEVGVVIGLGDTVEEAIKDLEDAFELLKDEPLKIEHSGFADLVESIENAEEHGMEFSDETLPSPESVAL